MAVTSQHVGDAAVALLVVGMPLRRDIKILGGLTSRVIRKSRPYPNGALMQMLLYHFVGKLEKSPTPRG